MEEPKVILVDIDDNPVGTAGKREAHETGLLHRAVSVFIFDTKGRWLLQRRNNEKYHSEGLWSNTCCSHPFPNEKSADAANRRLSEEMGISSPLSFAFKFSYCHTFKNGLTENETDHVFIGVTDESPVINKSEVSEFIYLDYIELKKRINQFPDEFTFWFKEIVEKVYLHISKENTIN